MVRSKVQTSHLFIEKLAKIYDFYNEIIFYEILQMALLRGLWHIAQISVYGENIISQYIISHRTCKVNVQNY